MLGAPIDIPYYVVSSRGTLREVGMKFVKVYGFRTGKLVVSVGGRTWPFDMIMSMPEDGPLILTEDGRSDGFEKGTWLAVKTKAVQDAARKIEAERAEAANSTPEETPTTPECSECQAEVGLGQETPRPHRQSIGLIVAGGPVYAELLLRAYRAAGSVIVPLPVPDAASRLDPEVTECTTPAIERPSRQAYQATPYFRRTGHPRSRGR